MEKYAFYQTEDFLRDESFINWVLNPEDAGNRSWTEWMSANPPKRGAAEEAISIIHSFDFKNEVVAESFYIDLKSRIDRTIAEGGSLATGQEGARAAGQEDKEQSRRVSLFPQWMKVAAIVAGILVGGWAVYYFMRPSYTVISTPYASLKTIWLPDSSEIVLNANSTIRFRDGMNQDTREVWLTGEAFFRVRHARGGGKASGFSVYAGDAKVEVLGTEFDVMSMHNTTGVMLQEGKVRFSIPGRNKEAVMRPGDYCLYNDSSGNMITHTANPVLYTSWLEHKYKFERTTVREICQTLKAYFGYDFIIRKPELAEQRISGTLELQNEQLLLNTLSALLNSSVTKTGTNIIIE